MVLTVTLLSLLAHLCLHAAKTLVWSLSAYLLLPLQSPRISVSQLYGLAEEGIAAHRRPDQGALLPKQDQTSNLSQTASRVIAEMQLDVNTRVEKSPRTLLGCLFLSWKLLLLTIALLGPGPDYDTSTQLLLHGYGTQDAGSISHDSAFPTSISPSTKRIVNSLTRWDAIYFASTAKRGYVFEQEWAFGWGFSRLLSYLSTSTFISRRCKIRYFCFQQLFMFSRTSLTARRMEVDRH